MEERSGDMLLGLREGNRRSMLTVRSSTIRSRCSIGM